MYFPLAGKVACPHPAVGLAAPLEPPLLLDEVLPLLEEPLPDEVLPLLEEPLLDELLLDEVLPPLDELPGAPLLLDEPDPGVPPLEDVLPPLLEPAGWPEPAGSDSCPTSQPARRSAEPSARTKAIAGVDPVIVVPSLERGAGRGWRCDSRAWRPRVARRVT